MANALVPEANRACIDGRTDCVQACEACAQDCLGDPDMAAAPGCAWTARPSARPAWPPAAPARTSAAPWLERSTTAGVGLFSGGLS
jgi:hypothetical protein